MRNSENIWNEYKAELKRFILSKTKDKEDVNDILQNVFIKLHSNVASIKDPAKIKPWLFQVTRNEMNDHFRTQKFSFDIDTFGLSEETVKNSANEQFFNCVKPHINKLPEKYREALTKVDLQNYSQLKLADELKISYSALKSRVQRGRELLKSYFKECCDITADKYGNIVSSEKKHKCTMC